MNVMGETSENDTLWHTPLVTLTATQKIFVNKGVFEITKVHLEIGLTASLSSFASA